jgi:hypothetical protein
VAFTVSPAWQVPDALQAELGEVLDMALADFDLDGRLDIVALGAEAVVVWSRPADDQPWQPLATAAVQGMSRLVVQDLDSDFDETRRAVPLPEATDDQPADATPLKDICPTADVDLVLYGAGGIALLENRFDAARGERTLVPVPTDQLPGELSDVRVATCADLDADGDLDLAIATGEGLRLWANLGEWSFADISERSALPEGLSDVAQLVAFDWDRDIDIDVLIAAPSGGGWLENVRHGQFRWRTFAEGFEPLAQAAALEPIDARGNASWDVVAGGADGARLVMTQTPRSGVLRAEAEAGVSDASAAGVIAWDYDNDGMDDLLTWSSDSVTLLRGLGDGRFVPVDLLTSVPAPIARAAIGDLDGDGDLDLAVLSPRPRAPDRKSRRQPEPLARGGSPGAADQRAAAFAQRPRLSLWRRVPLGAESGAALPGPRRPRTDDALWLGQADGRPTSYVSVGLTACPKHHSPGGRPVRVRAAGAQHVVSVRVCLERRAVCVCHRPLVERPLGLQLAEGQLAPWRDWEYLKIPGELLMPREGEYVLQLTAELWEADYFDQIKLIAVDHPADVAIYSNEKVGPAEIAEYKIHTVRQPRFPLSARNHAGRDLLPEIALEDGVFARTYERKLRQGVVEDHFFELDLGDLSQAERVTLYLTGWVFPASTSINVALSQGGQLSPPRPPWLEVSDRNGGWREVTPFMGFPGGKTKTIAVELEGRPVDRKRRGPAACRRFHALRIHTSMELYWDQIFFTVDERPAEVRTAELELVSADLHDRGFSRVAPDTSGKNGPSSFCTTRFRGFPNGRRWKAGSRAMAT